MQKKEVLPSLWCRTQSNFKAPYFNVVHTARLGEWLRLVQCLSGGSVLWCWLILVVVVSEILVKTVALPSHG